MNIQGDLARDDVGKLLVTLSLPAMVGMTVQALYNVVDTFWVGKLGPEAIAALTLCFPIQMILIAIGTGTGTGLSSVISRRLGESLHHDAVNTAEHGMMLVMIYGLLITGIGVPYAGPMLIKIGAGPQLLGLSLDYIQIILAGSILMFFAILSGSILQAQGDAGTPMKSMLTGAIINIILDPFMIFGWGPFPAMGVQGAALATVISQAGSCAINFYYIFIKKGILVLSLKNFSFSSRILSEIFKVGFPSIIMQLMNSVILVMINWILASYGYLALAAMGIYFRVESMLFMPIMGLTQGFLPIAGYAYGAQQLDRLVMAIKKASIGGLILMTIGFLAFQFFPAPIIRAFNDDPELIHIGVECMRNISILLPLVGPAIILSTTFQAVGKGYTAMWLSLLRQIVFLIPPMLILPHYIGLRGIWLAFPLSDFLSCIVIAWISVKYIQGLEKNGFPKKETSGS